MTVDQASIRETLARVPTTVSVVTTVDACGEPWGVTVGTFGFLSLAPPLVMFCLDRASASHEVLTTSARFLVHVLTDQQPEVAAAFARRGGHRFDDGFPTAHSLPTIPQALSRILCVQHSLVRGGDHTIVIGSVEDVDSGAGMPLLYHERRYCSLERRIECPARTVTAGSVCS